MDNLCECVEHMDIGTCITCETAVCDRFVDEVGTCVSYYFMWWFSGQSGRVVRACCRHVNLYNSAPRDRVLGTTLVSV